MSVMQQKAKSGMYGLDRWIWIVTQNSTAQIISLKDRKGEKNKKLFSLIANFVG